MPRLVTAASAAVFSTAFLSLASIAHARPVFVLPGTPIGQSRVSLVQISTDPFKNAAAAHKTEVESDNFAFGNTIVGTFQVGRYQDSDAGSTDIGWSTSSDGGTTWSHGYLPGITQSAFWSAPYTRVTDPAVAYDAKHQTWLIVSLPRGATTYLVPIVSRSPDGVNWQDPVHVAADNGDFMDKPWIACDNSMSSPFFGNCYVEYIDVYMGEVLLMSTSSDGGATWSTPIPSADFAAGNGGQPIVQPNGTVLVPFLGFSGIETVNSTNGGASWQSSVFIANANERSMPGNLRDPGPLPSAEIDAKGNAFVAWADCSFRPNCAANDIVFSTSSDGVHWSAVSRVPTADVNGTQDDWLPGFGVDHATAGSKAHVAVTYYYTSTTNCASSTCEVYVGYISSTNGGTTWNHPKTLAGPMQPNWLPNSDLGRMIGDYLSTSYVNGLARSTMPIAKPPKNGKFRQAIYTTATGLPAITEPMQLNTFGQRPRARRPALPRAIPLLH